MFTFRKLLVISLVLALLLPLVGCSSGPKMVQTWTEPGYTGPVFDNFVVVGVSKEIGTRRLFEDAFAGTLRGRGLSAYASYTRTEGEEKLTDAEIDAILTQTGANGILVTRLVAQDQKSSYQPSYVTAGPYYYNYYGYYNYAWGAAYAPGYVYSYEVIRLETNLYDADEDNKLLWSGTSEIVDFTSIDREVPRLADKVLKELESEGLI